MERICRPANLNKAYQRVKANKGSPGVDGLSVHELGDWLRTHKNELIASLMQGSYRPQPIKRVDIPKPGGGMRQLGIPTTVDRVIQQAILQVLTPILDPTFSESSFGFRPGRGAHDALMQASRYVEQGRAIVVDCDLEKFFDRVNHDILMSRLARRIGDKRLLRIIRRFLTAGIMTNGVCVTRYEGTPQGGHYRRYRRISCSTTWTRNWRGGDTASAAMPTTATSTSKARRRESGLWNPSHGSWRSGLSCG